MAKNIKTVLFNGLEFELNAPHDNAHVKHFLLFDDSQARLYKAKFERHPSSAEIHALVCAYMDDKEKGTHLLNELQVAAADDAMQGAGEHFSQAMKVTEQRLLVFYEGVTAITGFPSFNQDGYLEDGLKYSGCIREFDVSDLELDAPNPYSKIYSKHNDLVEYLSSRCFDDLPEGMKEYGDIRLPKPGKYLWPIGGVQFIDRTIFGASRGVRKAKKY